MKKFLLPALLVAVLSACGNNNKAQENALLDSLNTVHEKIMNEDGQTMKAKADLKQLLTKTPALKDSITLFLVQLDNNDNLMMDWMNKFNPEFTGKTHDQIMTYLKSQRAEVLQIDSQLKKGNDAAISFYKSHTAK